MNVLYLFTIVILAFANTSCDSASSNERISEPPHYELTADDEAALTEVFTDMREELQLDSNFVMICPYCTARINAEVLTCDSCGLNIPEAGGPILSLEQINAFEVTCCMSCGKLIPEDAAACKYCMGIQPLNE